MFEEIYRERLRYMPGAATLIQTMRARGAMTALVSGGFVPFTDRVRAALGFDLAQANRLEISGGRVTGRLLAPIRDPEQARDAAAPRPGARPGGGRHARGRRRRQRSADAGAAGLGVAFRAHPVVRAAVPVAIRDGDLTALLYLQGIARRDFVLA